MFPQEARTSPGDSQMDCMCRQFKMPREQNILELAGKRPWFNREDGDTSAIQYITCTCLVSGYTMSMAILMDFTS
jgi:hypothetical protein